MKVSLSQSFLTALERIDNVVMIDKCKIDTKTYNPEVVYHNGAIQICIVGVEESECDKLDFYYDTTELAFTIIDDEPILLNPVRTLFKFTFPVTPKAIIDCPWLTEDTKFLESIGPKFGSSLYKDIEISEDSLVWKESLRKYVVDKGLTDNHVYDVERLDTKSGKLEERPIRFKSYQNIIVDQGEWRIKSTKYTSPIKHNVYSELSDSTFLVWDSPMIDATVNLKVEPECINNLKEYLDPGNVVFGNTDCFQFTNYQSSLRGFRVEGVEGSEVDFLFNKEYTQGDYTSFRCKIGSEGVAEVRISELPYYHFNGILAVGPSKITKVETIMYLEEYVDTYIPDPDKTYVVDIENVGCTIKLNATCEYIEYEKYLGEVQEIGRGVEHIDSIPEIIIKRLDNSGGLIVEDIDTIGKQIKCLPNSSLDREVRYGVFQIQIANNINVNGNVITTSELVSDYKVRIEQVGFVWKITNSPDYVEEDGYGIYLWNYREGATRTLKIITNNPNVVGESLYSEAQSQSISVFNIPSIIEYGGSELIDGDYWYVFYITISTKNPNDRVDADWRPKGGEGGDDPFLIKFKYEDVVVSSISFYAIQLRKIDPNIEVLEETLPGKFSYVDTGIINIYNSLVKTFVIVKRDDVTTSQDTLWYYYDLNGLNNFYITDLSSQITNNGFIFYTSTETTLLDLGEERTVIGRVINVNRSDLIGSLGVLTITESPAFPGSWRDLVNNNTVNVEVTRELTNIYINVGQAELKNEDYVLKVSTIGVYTIKVQSNFKYVIETFGYLKFYSEGDISYNNTETRREVFSGYNQETEFNISLIRLDEEPDIANSFIEIRSGNLVRRVTLEIVGPTVENDYKTSGVAKPNIIRILGNGTVSPETNYNFLYTTTTTPTISFVDVVKSSENISVHFDSNNYKYHISSVKINVPNSKSLSYSKYPIKSFGSIKESSLSYSDKEDAPLEYLFYMKGKKHHLWSVDNISGFSGLNDSNEGDPNLYVDASGESGILVYVVSRYGVDNRTFITETPKTNEIKITRNNLEASFKISQQQKIAIDEATQIEYAIPIQVNCNIENTGGNIFLGNLIYKAYTEVSESSVSEVIEVPGEIADLEEIDENYLKTHILNEEVEETQILSINVFQQGTNPEVFDIFSDVSDMGIMAETQYIIPEIGSNYTLYPSNFDCEVTTSGYGSRICTITPECTKNYFLVTVESEDRIPSTGEHWFNKTNLPTNIINSTDYNIVCRVPYVTSDGGSGTKTFESSFKKYGCYFGLLVDTMCGFGYVDPKDYKKHQPTVISVPAEGGKVCIHAGIFYAVDGVWSTEALIVPLEYKFIDGNIPDEVLWEDGNNDDEGNLIITIPPRTRDDYGNKEFILQVTHNIDDYCPLNLYVVFSQSSFYTGSPDSSKNNYKLRFLKDQINIYSDGSVEGENDKLYFSHNLNKELFDNVVFDWVAQPGNTIPSSPDDLSLEEVERNYEEGYVRFKFKPNGSQTLIKANIRAMYYPDYPSITGGKELGTIKATQGYFCLIANYINQKMYDMLILGNIVIIPNNYISRLSPKQVTLYSITDRTTGIISKEVYGYLPCKANNDNSDCSLGFCLGRGVFKLTAYKREFNDSSQIAVNLKDVVKEVKILKISPETLLKSYSASFISESFEDHDAKVNKRFQTSGTSGYGYVTNHDFSVNIPYYEINFEIIEEYIREINSFGVSNNIVLVDNNGHLHNFYFSTSFYSRNSDEPPSISSLTVNPTKLMFDYRGGQKQVSFSPTSMRNMISITMVPDKDNWITVTPATSNSNFITFTAKENKSTDSKKAYYRTCQVKLDIKDPRDSYLLKSFLIDIEQQSDTSGSGSGDSGGGEEGGLIPSSIYVGVKVVNNTGKNVPITGEIKMYVGGHNGIFINLPGASSTTTWGTITAGAETSTYQVNCVGNGVKPENFLDQTIESSLIVYAPDEGYHNSEWISATISGGSNIFAKNANYTITLNSYSPEQDVNIKVKFVNARNSVVLLCGKMELEVSDGNGGTVTINADLPGATTTSNYYSIPIGSETEYYSISCTGSNGINPADYLGKNIVTTKIYTYMQNQTLMDYYRPHPIVSPSAADKPFVENGSYTIQFDPD